MPAPSDEILANPWNDDVLDRSHLAKMLESHLMTHFMDSGGAPLAIAIDGRWGSGKTFFVQRWIAQLRNNKRCVIEFDAWQHDQSGNPALAFMAEISRQVKERTALMIDSTATMNAVDRALNDTISSIKRAAKPVSKALLAAAFKKFVGLSVKDLAESISSGGGDDADSEDATGTKDADFDQAIDKYLDQVMAEHELRHASVQKFRENLEGLAKSLARASAGPVFVIIDELDRCRPNFALQLLEGVKHLFSVDNVCFVFSTNLSQLAASVQAVYGPNFDGRDYLGRFFDQELRLPLPTGEQFARLLFHQHSNSSAVSLRSYGSFTFSGFSGDHRGVEIWAGISQAMGVTLRQQQQAFSTFLIACESYPKYATIPALWLIFLALLHRANPSAFATLQAVKGHGWDAAKFADVLRGMPWQDQTMHVLGRRAEGKNSRIRLGDLLFRYFHLSKHVQPEDIKLVNAATDYATEDLGDYLSGRGNHGDPSNLHLPFDIVSMAGLFSSGANDND